MAAITGSVLREMREIQQVTAPNMCLGASKFLALKIMGLVNSAKHLNDFLMSPWAAEHSSLNLANCWGWDLGRYADAFNRQVLPAVLNESSGLVRANTSGTVRAKFEYFFSDTLRADGLLRGGVPLVVGVSIHGSTSRDHFIVVVRGADGVWAVDPWPGAPSEAVKVLPPNFTFSEPSLIHLTADEKHTRIPCGTPFFGYFAR